MLKNPKYERFCLALSRGETQSAAYRIAGYRPSDAHASTLAARPEIKARVLQLREEAARKELKAEDCRVNTLVSTAFKIINTAIAKGDLRSAVRMLEILLQVYGYKDSPSLFHEHLFGEGLTPKAVQEIDSAQEAREMARVGSGMAEALGELTRQLKAKTISGQIQ